MKKLLLLFSITLFYSMVCAQNTQLAGEWQSSLDGEWRFTIDSAIAGQKDGAWDRISVPGNWDTMPAYATHRGVGWYERDFNVSKEWKGKLIRIRFEAVYHEAEVTLNGQVLGKHVGGYTPFEFDVTNLLNYEGTNTVTVRADNTYRRGAFWPWGGISRSVNLIANNEVRIVQQHIRSEPDLTTGTAKVFVQYKLANSSTMALKVAVVSLITPSSGVRLNTEVTLAPKSEQIVELSVSLRAADVRLWHFDHPNLYTLTTRVTVADAVVHTKVDRFGIRKIAVTPEGLFLNGEKIRVAGFNRVSDSNQFGNTEPDELVRKDIDLMKTAGSVFTRIMHSPQAPNLLDYLDEKGMLIFCEIPVWGEDPQLKKDNPLTKQWLREMIERDYNHPCIIGWSPGNELQKHYDYVASMNAYISKELDPHRLVAYVSNTADRKEYGPENDPVTVSDIAMINVYGGPGSFANTSATLRKRWPDKPVFFSEYGVDQVGASLNSKIFDLKAIWKNMTKDSFVIGASMWTFNDYRSDYKNTPASGNREWGVVDVDRRLKAGYWEIRKIHSPLRELFVKDGVVNATVRTPAEVPSYTLRGYRLDWTLLDAAGKTTAHGSLPLPDLSPGAPTWKGIIPNAKLAASLKVNLMTPTGYAVDDCESTVSVR